MKSFMIETSVFLSLLVFGLSLPFLVAYQSEVENEKELARITELTNKVRQRIKEIDERNQRTPDSRQ